MCNYLSYRSTGGRFSWHYRGTRRRLFEFCVNLCFLNYNSAKGYIYLAHNNDWSSRQFQKHKYNRKLNCNLIDNANNGINRIENNNCTRQEYHHPLNGKLQRERQTEGLKWMKNRFHFGGWRKKRWAMRVFFLGGRKLLGINKAFEIK